MKLLLLLKSGKKRVVRFLHYYCNEKKNIVCRIVAGCCIQHNTYVHISYNTYVKQHLQCDTLIADNTSRENKNTTLL